MTIFGEWTWNIDEITARLVDEGGFQTSQRTDLNTPKAVIECKQSIVLYYNCQAPQHIFSLEVAQFEIPDECANEIKKTLDKVYEQ